MDFNRFARPYTWMADHHLWRRALREAARHLPPSAASLTLLDVGCGAGVALKTLTDLRPDITPIGLDAALKIMVLGRRRGHPGAYLNGDARRLPFASASIDAVLIQRVYYFISDPAQFLQEALRVLRPGGRLIMLDPIDGRSPLGAVGTLRYGPHAMLDMVALRLGVMAVGGGVTLTSTTDALNTAGFARLLSEPLLDGWVVLSRGEKPHTVTASMPDRIAMATASASGEVLHGEAIHHTKGRYIHLLVRQLPEKPGWALTDVDLITWGAAATPLADGNMAALAFTSLPQAVAFMQQAILGGMASHINKVVKFSKASAATWDFPILLNPDPDQRPPLAPHLISVDPATAEAPDE